MALNAVALADELATAIGQVTTTTQLIGWAQAVVTEITANGSATSRNIPTPHPISGVTGPSLAALIAANAGYPFVSPQLTNYATAIATHITTNAIVTYDSPVAAPPGIPPANAWFLNGVISGMNGPGLASEIAAAVGYPFVSSQLLAKSIALVSHIETNGQVTDGVIS